MEFAFKIFKLKITLIDLDPSDGDIDVGLKFSCGSFSIGLVITLRWKEA